MVYSPNACGRKPYPERKSCGFKNIRIRAWTGSSRQLFVANRGGISNRKLKGAALPDCHEKNIYIIINK